MRARWASLAAVLALCGASCSSTVSSGPTSTGASSGTRASSKGAAGGSLTGMASEETPEQVVWALMPGQPTQADPSFAALVDAVQAQIAGKVDVASAVASVGGPGHSRPMRSGNSAVDLVVLDLLIMGRVLPSKEGAQALAGMSEAAAGAGGLDAPDGPVTGSQSQSAPFDSSSSAGRMSGTVSLAINVTTEHSKVTVDLTRALVATFASATGTETINITVLNVESVDFCPDIAGVVPVSVASDVTTSTGTSTIHFSIDGDFTGTVDDNANLATVAGEAKVSGATVTGNDTSDDYDIGLTGVGFPPAGDGSLGDANAGQYVPTKNNGADIAGAVQAAAIDLKDSLSVVFQAAEGIWQSSGCVTVQIPDFDTYAPRHHGTDPADFVKEIDPGEKLSFTTQVHHRFLHTNVNVTVDQTLATEVSLEPAHLSSTPAKSTYEAPNKESASNQGTFKSQSRRGRSELVGRFFLHEKGPTIGLTGTIKEQSSFATLTGTVTMTPLNFGFGHASDNGDYTEYEVDGPVTANVVLDSLGGLPPPCAAYATEQGTIHLVAHSEARGDSDRVWVIHPDPGKSHFDITGTCQISAGNALSGGGGYSAKFFAALGDFEIPTTPATTHIAKQRTIGASITDSSDADVTLVPPAPGN